MGHLMPITYLPPTSHLQSYYLPTNPPTHLLTYSPTYMDVLPTYPNTYLHTCIMYLHTHPPTYIYTYYLPAHATYPPTYLPMNTHPPISYNLPIFIPHNLVVMCWNNMWNQKNWQKLRFFLWCGPLVKDLVYHWGGQEFNS